MARNFWIELRETNSFTNRCQVASTRQLGFSERERHEIWKSENRPYRESTSPENRQPKRSFTGSSNFCLHSEVAFCCQDGGVTEKKLYLLQFAAVHMAELKLFNTEVFA